MGSIVGAKGGATLGALVGSIFPGPGTVIGGFIGSLIGATAGTYADNKYLIPALFPEQRQKPLDLEDASAQQNQEGSPAFWCLGAFCRVPGTTIFYGKEQTNQGGGTPGKGSTAATTGGTNYYRNVGIAWNVDIGSIYEFTRIIAEGKVIWVNNDDVAISSDLLTATRYVTYRWDEHSDSTAIEDVFLEITSPNTGPDLSVLISGIDCDVAGWGTANNNGTHRVVFSEINTGTGVSKVRLRANGVSEAAGPTVTIDQVLPKTQLDFADAVTNYDGASDQDPDPDWQAEAGATNVSAARGVAYSFINRLKLNEFGLRVPQFTCELKADMSLSLQSAFTKVLTRCGLTNDEFDVSLLVGSMQGGVIAGPTEGAQILLSLMMGYNILAADRDGKLTFFHRELATEVPVDVAHMAPSASADEVVGEFPFAVVDDEEGALPTQVVVNYLDRFNELQSGSQIAINRLQGIEGDSIQSASFPFMMSAEEAAQAANRMLWTRWANSKGYSFALTPRYSYLQEGDVVTFTYDGQDHRVLALKVTHNWDGRIFVEGVREVLSTLTFPSVPNEAPTQEERDTYEPPEIRVDVLDVHPLRAADANDPGFYWSVFAYDRRAQSKNTSLSKSTVRTAWNNVQDMRREATAGETENDAATVTALGAASAAYWDMGNTITVTLFSGALSSASSDLEVLNYEVNQALIGSEIIGFRYATPLGDNRYELSRLIRGRQGTQRWMSRHSVNERFLLLEEDNIRNKSIPRNQTGQAFYYDAKPDGGVIGDFRDGVKPNLADSTSWSYAASMAMWRLKPFAPANVRASRSNGQLEYILYWKPVARDLGSWYPGPTTSSEGRFWIRWWDNDPELGGNLLYTIWFQSMPSMTEYFRYMGLTDHNNAGISLGDPHWVTVSEFWSTYGGYGWDSPAILVDM